MRQNSIGTCLTIGPIQLFRSVADLEAKICQMLIWPKSIFKDTSAESDERGI